MLLQGQTSMQKTNLEMFLLMLSLKLHFNYKIAMDEWKMKAS